MAEFSETADGTLVIMVCRAKHLPNRRKLDKQSPYVLLRINTTAKKTPSHFRAGQTPEWTFEIRFKLGRERKPIMRLDVLDETKSDPTPIGGTEIDCSRVFLDPANLQEGGKYIWDSWHDLDFRGKQAGKIYLEMTFYPSAPVVPPKIGFLHTSDALEDVSDDESPEFRHLAPSPNRSPIMHDVFVSGDQKKANIFRRSDPERPIPPVKSASSDGKKGGTFDRLRNKFRSKEAISTLWANENKPKSSYVQELPVHDHESLNFAPLPAVTLEDIDTGAPPPPPPHSEFSVFTKNLSPSERNHHSPERIVHGRMSPLRDNLPPPPPPKSGLTSPTPLSPTRSLVKSSSRSPGRSPGRKPPPGATGFEKSTEIPFSAESFGLDDEEDHLPTAVYHMGEQVKSLTFQSPNKKEPSSNDDIDPKHYAPTPSEHLAKSLRLQNGQMQFKDVQVDLKTEQTGYLGEGKWDTQRFSPSIFDRIHDESLNRQEKPSVPPKIPNGLSEREYYVLEKENYLKDLNDRRTY
ncbi:hypothetical protein PUMCH_003002 [Australozyma saopauloensis]|uniref:C2 domain-containing protein n=1 Tax=Australozyma saopauloensis TaxID=291208 RepID=A0AAX4HCU1_9ASCO|nr:hypothetical protein PUMCH_003002 [[Candida] saopauloensis]